jgi:hypothetical protein
MAGRARVSGVHPAVHGQIRAGDVRGVGASYECNQRSDLVNVSVAVECSDGFLRYSPITRGRIQIRVDRARLHVVDRDTPAPDFSRQPLGEYLHRPLGGRVGYEPRRLDTLSHGGTNVDDAAAIFHVLQSSLRCSEYAADVDVEYPIHLLQRRLLECLGNGRPRIVHNYIEPTESRGCLVDRSFGGFGVGSVRLEAAAASFAYVMATLAPSSARRFAIAAPIPREPPVTSATLFASLDIDLLSIPETIHP